MTLPFGDQYSSNINALTIDLNVFVIWNQWSEMLVTIVVGKQYSSIVVTWLGIRHSWYSFICYRYWPCWPIDDDVIPLLTDIGYSFSILSAALMGPFDQWRWLSPGRSIVPVSYSLTLIVIHSVLLLFSIWCCYSVIFGIDDGIVIGIPLTFDIIQWPWPR